MCCSCFRECLKGTIVNSQDAEVSCADTTCESKLLDREIKAVNITPQTKAPTCSKKNNSGNSEYIHFGSPNQKSNIHTVYCFYEP